MSEIRVRMYKELLGDCFLLTFGDNQAHMLIDCGLIIGAKGSKEKMREVADNIRQTTGGRLDVLVATHEHWDHLSGFLQAREVFEQIEIDNVWLAWTEDPNNEVAKGLRRKRRQKVRALEMAFERLHALGTQKAARLAGQVEGLLGFFGREPGAASLRAAAGGTTEEAIEWLAQRPGATLRYCEPGGMPLAVKGIEDVRIYVLGPPQDPQLIKQDLPSKLDPETYELTIAGGLEQAFLAAVQARRVKLERLSAEERDQVQRSQPFDQSCQTSTARARRMRFFQQHYGFGDAPEDPQAWRRIEDDWLGVAGQLALDLDSDTNNTSLVLAIELGSSGKVLLFAADAQVGNWLSWEKLSWSVPGDGGTITKVTAADLLQRAVLYKVGHHGSHNATLREKGLELMTSPELVAMIPVVETMARQKGWERMPFQPLLQRLQEKANGRVLRGDEQLDASRSGWRGFRKQVSEGPRELYVDYTVGQAQGLSQPH